MNRVAYIVRSWSGNSSDVTYYLARAENQMNYSHRWTRAWGDAELFESPAYAESVIEGGEYPKPPLGDPEIRRLTIEESGIEIFERYWIDTSLRCETLDQMSEKDANRLFLLDHAYRVALLVIGKESGYVPFKVLGWYGHGSPAPSAGSGELRYSLPNFRSLIANDDEYFGEDGKSYVPTHGDVFLGKASIASKTSGNLRLHALYYQTNLFD